MSFALWAMLISALCGWQSFGEPLEDLLRGARNVVRARPADGSVAVIGEDDATLAQVGADHSRAVDSRVLENLFRHGVRQVYYDYAFSQKGDPAGDQQFIKTLARHRHSVFLGIFTTQASHSRGQRVLQPISQFRQVADVAAFNGYFTPFLLSAKLPLAEDAGGTLLRTMSATIADRQGVVGQLYRPDWSISVKTIPTFSFFDIWQDKISDKALRGKVIIIGPTAENMHDLHRIVGQGYVPGVYFHAIGAQTLKEGTPRDLGWVPPYLVMLTFSLAILRARSRRLASFIGIAAYGVITGMAFYTDSIFVTVDYIPALLLFSIIAFRMTTRLTVAEHVKRRSVSDLPSVMDLAETTSAGIPALVALKLCNMAAVRASFSDDVQRKVYNELRRRIVLADCASVYQGDDGLFWNTCVPLAMLRDHLHGLAQLLSAAIHVEGRRIDIQIALGVDHDTDRLLMSRIGSALLAAEEAAASGSVVKFYDPGRQGQVAWELSLMSELDTAIDCEQLSVAYQPQVHLRSGRVVGAEALVRWTHPIRGVIPPDDFILTAERHNRLKRLTEFVLERAMRDTLRILDQHPDFRVAVNISASLLNGPWVIDTVSNLLGATGMSAGNLTIEITETAPMQDRNFAQSTMAELRKMGVYISIDDYGSGNATIDYIKSLPFDEIKLDRKFTSQIAFNKDDCLLVRSTVELVHDLKKSIVADGIENAEAMKILSDFGCDIGQGYYVGRPMNFGDFELYIELPKRIGVL